MKKTINAAAILAIAAPAAFRFPKAEDFAPLANSEVIIPPAVVKQAAEVIAVAMAPTKADKARAIFAECYAMEQVPERKAIIGRAIAEAGLTKAGAATYLQNYKDKQGLSVKRTAASA
jgi:hypothetical protein